MKDAIYRVGVIYNIYEVLGNNYRKKVDNNIEKGVMLLLNNNIIHDGDDIHDMIKRSISSDMNGDTIDIYENKVDDDILIQVILNLNNLDESSVRSKYMDQIKAIIKKQHDDFRWLSEWLAEEADNIGYIDTDGVKKISTDLSLVSENLRCKIFRDYTDMIYTVNKLPINYDIKEILSTRVETYLTRYYTCNIITRPRCSDKIDITITWSLHTSNI
jgi:hypothetical protein